MAMLISACGVCIGMIGTYIVTKIMDYRHNKKIDKMNEEE